MSFSPSLSEGVGPGSALSSHRGPDAFSLPPQTPAGDRSTGAQAHWHLAVWASLNHASFSAIALPFSVVSLDPYQKVLVGARFF